jgi:hypothetical protein
MNSTLVPNYFPSDPFFMVVIFIGFVCCIFGILYLSEVIKSNSIKLREVKQNDK